MPLNNSEIAINKGEVDFVLMLLVSQKNVSEETLEVLRQRLNKYAQDHLITLNNLLATEQQKLVAILCDSLQQQNQEQFLDLQLNQWHAELYHAVQGRNKLKDLHAQMPTGLKQEFHRKGWVSPTANLTDLDIEAYLEPYSISPENIDATERSYIFKTISITESSAALQDVLHRTITTITKKNIQPEIEVRIPVNLGDSHWCELKLGIQQNTVNSAHITDPSSFGIRATDAGVANIKKAIKDETHVDVNVNKTYKDQRTEGFLCGDYTMQNILTNSGHDNDPLVQLGTNKEPKLLRATVANKVIGGTGIKLINTEVGETLVKNDVNSAEFAEKIALEENDAKLAHKVQELYRSELAKGKLDDNKLFDKVIEKAKVELNLTTFFSKYENNSSTTRSSSEGSEARPRTPSLRNE